ncbi:MAG: transcriptional regulator [Marivirga sp.]|nr:transcriptional regulator [Marivirga sp.]
MIVTKKEKVERTQQTCMRRVMAVRDALDVLNGRWKLPILISVSFGTKRFKQISKEINGITDKMLSKELKDLEVHQLVKRTVYDTFPPTVEYAITDHGRTLEKVIDELGYWGMEHRRKIIGK